MNLWIVFLRGLATLAVNPALGGGGVSRERLAQYLNFGADLVERGEDAREAFELLAQEVDEMARTGRQPSQRDFDTLKARSEAAWEKIQEAKRRLGAEEETGPPPPNPPNPESTEPGTVPSTEEGEVPVGEGGESADPGSADQ